MAHCVYLTLIVLIAASIVSLRYIKTDITIKTQGITRPKNERAEIRAVVAGIIDTVFSREGQQVEKNEIILRIKDPGANGKQIHNRFEVDQRKSFIHDLALLTSSAIDDKMVEQLRTPLYIEQLNHFIQQKTEQEILLRKADKEVEINTSLAKDKVISPKEFFDIQNNQEKLHASVKTLIQSQLSSWQQDLARYQLELSQFTQQENEVSSNAVFYEVRASVAGIIQGIATRYSGGSIQANETICSISPEGTIIGECYVQTKDVGLLKINQPVRYQVDAFDYNYFGVLTGKIIQIDNDFTSIDNKPLFKVYCSFDSSQLHLRNGYTGHLKKGLGFQANFTVTRRSLWQLLFDKLDDWLNPNAPTANLITVR
ncbi:MAG: HlyD family efflux transporter periplasmic adaptor subunit [Bacteroidota bacterium]